MGETENSVRSLIYKFFKIIICVSVGSVILLFSFNFLINSENKHLKISHLISNLVRSNMVHSLSPEILDKTYDGELVKISGIPVTYDSINDEIFGVEEKAIKLRRIVEIYQSIDRNKKDQKPILDWSSKIHTDSKKRNILNLPYDPKEHISKDVFIGKYRLSENMIKQICHEYDYHLTSKNFAKLHPELKKSYNIHEGKYYSGNPKNPQIGSSRVYYKITRPHVISVIGQQNQNLIDNYTISGFKIDTVQRGEKTIDELLNRKNRKSSDHNNIVIAIASIAIFIGMNLCIIGSNTIIDHFEILKRYRINRPVITSAVICVMIFLTSILLPYII